jgi:hypothetical protein
MQTACLSHAYLLAGRLQDASTLAGRALESSRAHRERGNRAYALRLLGDIAAQRDPPHVEEAEARWITGVVLPVDAGLLATTPLAMLRHLR